MSGRIASAFGSVRPMRSRIVRNGLIAAVVTGVLLAGAMVAAPFLIEGEAAKSAIEKRLTELTGGEFRYEALQFRVWPRPAADLRGLTFRVPPLVDGTAERARLRFALLPLLKGDLRISRMRLERPVVVMRVAGLQPGSLGDDPIATYRNAISPALAWLALHADGLELSIRDGAVDLQYAGEPSLKLDALTLDGQVSDDAVEAKAAARATSWKQARASVKIATASHAANLELAFDDLDAERVLAALPGAPGMRVHPAATDATLSVQTDGQRSATAGLSVSTPALALARGGARVDLGATRARLKGSYAPGDSSLTVEELAVGDWLANGSGSLKLGSGASGTQLDAKAGRVDAARLRAAALAIGPDIPWISTTAAVVKAGNALDVRIVAAGNDVKALADFAVYEISMDVDKATFDVPVPPMELAPTSGKLRIAKSTLSARDVAATFGASKLRSGELVLTLMPAVVLRSLSATVDLDLAENHARVRYLSRETPIGAELDRLQSIAGRAAGTFALRDEGGRLRETYDMTSVNATLRHPGVPFPIVIDRGRFTRETGGELVVRGVAGTIGASRVDPLDAEISLGPAPAVRSAAGAATLNLDELAPWILGTAPLKRLRDGVLALQGIVDVKVSRLAGPLNAADRIDIAATITPRKLRLTASHLPGRLALDGGTVRLEGADLSFDGVDAEIQDARGSVSGSVRGYATPARTFDVTVVRATIGPRGLEWLEDEAGIGPGARLQAPIALDRARIRWPLPAPWSLEASAAASFRNGARAEFDLLSRPGQVNVRRLTFKDQDSDVRIVVDWQPDRVIVGYHGVVSARSIARMVTVPVAASGTLRGDFDATIDFRDPALSRASGKLEGADVVLPAAFDVPVTIARLSVDADGDRLRVRDTALRVGEEPLNLAGSIARAGGRLNVDATIGAESIDAQQWLARLGASEKDSKRASPWSRSLAGKIVLRAGHLEYAGYRLEPFVASMVLGGDSLTADVTEASLCGLAVPFKLTASGGALQLEGQASAKDLPLGDAAPCLSRGRLSASGTMEVRASFSASGSASSLLASTRGSAKLRARDGRIGGVRALARVVEVDEVSQRLPKAEVEAASQGIAFSTLEIEASLAGERVTIERALIESAAINIAMQGQIRLDDRQVALTGVALPIVSTLLKSVPVIGQIVGDPVVGIPISVTGDIADPQVNRVGAGAIAGALLGTLQSVVSLPVQLLGGAPAPAAAEPR